MTDKYTPASEDRYTPASVLQDRPGLNFRSPSSTFNGDNDDDEESAALVGESVANSNNSKSRRETEDSLLDELLQDLDSIPTNKTEMDDDEADGNKEAPVAASRDDEYDILVIDTAMSNVSEPPPLMSPNEELQLLAVKLKPNSPDRDDDEPLTTSRFEPSSSAIRSSQSAETASAYTERANSGPMFMEDDHGDMISRPRHSSSRGLSPAMVFGAGNATVREEDDQTRNTRSSAKVSARPRVLAPAVRLLSAQESPSAPHVGPVSPSAVDRSKQLRSSAPPNNGPRTLASATNESKIRATFSARQPGAVAVSRPRVLSPAERKISKGDNNNATGPSNDVGPASNQNDVPKKRTSSPGLKPEGVAMRQRASGGDDDKRSSKRRGRHSRTSAPGAVAVAGVGGDGPSNEIDNESQQTASTRSSDRHVKPRRSAPRGPGTVAVAHSCDDGGPSLVGEEERTQLSQSIGTSNSQESKSKNSLSSQRPGAVQSEGRRGRGATKFSSRNDVQHIVSSFSNEKVKSQENEANHTGWVARQESAPSLVGSAEDTVQSSAIHEMMSSGSDLSIPMSFSSRSRPNMTAALSAELVTAEVYDAEAKREEVRRQAEQDAEARILASAITAEAKVIEDESVFNWKLYCGIVCLLIIVVVVVVSVLATRSEPADPYNDICENAFGPLNMTGGIVEGLIEPRAGVDNDVCQVKFGEGYGLWYYIVGDGSRLSASTCIGSDLDPQSDTQIMVFAGSCNNPICIGGSDELCGAHGTVGWMAEEGMKYFILVKGFRASNVGRFTLTINALEENDYCDNASSIDWLDIPIFGSTRNQTLTDQVDGCGATDVVAPVSWYHVEGDGSVMCGSAATDQGESPEFPVQLSIYLGFGCVDLTCLDGVLQKSKTPALTSEIAWLAEESMSFFILVHGEENDAEGDFLLNLRTAPTNGICEMAPTVAIGGNLTSGTVAEACNVELNECSGANLDLPGVWYVGSGTGNLLIASVSGLSCEGENSERISSITVYSGSTCSALECVDFVQEACGPDNQRSTTKWFSNPGELFYLYVQSSDPSEFTLAVDEFIPEVADDCDNATMLEATSEAILGATSGASVDNLGSCASPTSPGVFYRVSGTGEELFASSCNAGTNFAVDITILAGSCETFECVDAAVVSCDGLRSIAYWSSVVGETYYIHVRGTDGSEPDTGRFNLTVGEGRLGVENDFCGTAIELTIPTGTFGSTQDATLDQVELCGSSGTALGVWYSVIGSGANLTASLCGDGTDYDTQIYVFSGGCNKLTCIASDDDACGAQSSVVWMAEAGENYFVLVSGFQNDVGNFELTLEEN